MKIAMSEAVSPAHGSPMFKHYNQDKFKPIKGIIATFEEGSTQNKTNNMQ